MDFDTKGGMSRCSTRESNTRGSSTNNEKPLPNYLRASTSSCHDFCRYGRKHVEAEAKNSFLFKSDKKLPHGEEPHEIDNSASEERRKKHTVKLKSSSTINKQKPKMKKEFTPTSENERSREISITAGGQKKNISHDNGIDSVQKSGSIKKNTLSPQEATLSIAPALVTKTSMKNMASKKTTKTAGKGLLSPLAPSNKSTVQINEDEYLKSGEIMETLQKKMMQSSKSSPSLKHVVNGNMSLQQKQSKFGKPTTFTKNQKFGKSEYDTQRNGDKTMHAIDQSSQNVDSASTDQSLEAHNVASDSSKESLSKYENRDLKSLQKKLLDLENSGGMDILGDKLLEFENVDMNFPHGNFLKSEKIVFESLEREAANQKFVTSKNAIVDFQEEKLKKPNDASLDTLELKQNDCKLLKQENAEMDFHVQRLRKHENNDLDFLELNSDDDQLNSDDFLEEIEESTSVYSESTVVHPQVELSTPYKLKLRRGKIIEPQPESSRLRRLRFRRQRLVDLSATVGQSEKKNFRSNEKIAKGSDPNPNAAQNVMLKHQEQEKKDTQSLFNSTIEETASKLVECRKSKVKALVGAFETVISLQDSKPASIA